MIVKTLPVGPVETNCYLIADPNTLDAAVIDPGGDAPRILKAIDALKLHVRYVLNTHGHFDHIMANAAVVDAIGAELCIHPGDAELLADGGGAAFFGMEASSPAPTHLLADGETLLIGGIRLQVLFTPGHTPGGCSFYSRAGGVLFSGDCLFQMGIGRSDLPGGDPYVLARSLKERLMALPDPTVVYPGHGPSTTIGHERI